MGYLHPLRATLRIVGYGPTMHTGQVCGNSIFLRRRGMDGTLPTCHESPTRRLLPVAQAWKALSKAVFSPTKRFTQRAIRKAQSSSVSAKSSASDEEAIIGDVHMDSVPPTPDKDKAPVPQTPVTPPELRVQPPLLRLRLRMFEYSELGY